MSPSDLLEIEAAEETLAARLYWHLDRSAPGLVEQPAWETLSDLDQSVFTSAIRDLARYGPEWAVLMKAS